MIQNIAFVNALKLNDIIIRIGKSKIKIDFELVKKVDFPFFALFL